MTKIIFLDIDGVLNNIQRCQWLHENGARGMGFGSWGDLDKGNITQKTVGWDPRNVEALWHIINETNADIVISSVWRKMTSLASIRSFFKPFGDIPRIVGKTPTSQMIPDGVPSKLRGDEVNFWLSQFPNITKWVCLDDDGDFHPENNLVKIDIEVGLTMEDAERAIEILKD